MLLTTYQPATSGNATLLLDLRITVPDRRRHECRLNTIHNLYYYQQLMAGLRGAIAAGRLVEFSAEFYEKRGQQALPVYNTPFL